MHKCLLLLALAALSAEAKPGPAVPSFDKFFKAPVLPRKKPKAGERQLKNQMQALVGLLLHPKPIKKKTAQVSIADKLNMLDDFEKEADKIQSKQFRDQSGKRVFAKTKRKLLQTLSDRRLDLSLCKQAKAHR